MTAIVHADLNELASAAATDFARRLIAYWQDALGTELVGAYLIGSLAHAGFSRRYSDIDIALVTETGIPDRLHDHMRDLGMRLSPDWGSKVSVFWTDRHFSVGRFPALDRVDYLDHAIAVVEHERVRPARPTLDDIHEYLAGAPLTNWTTNARRFASAATFERKDHKSYLRTLLYPARFCYSWLTGRISSNDDAVDYLRARRVAGLDIDLIARALHCRQIASDPDALFPARTALLSQIDACVGLVKAANTSL